MMHQLFAAPNQAVQLSNCYPTGCLVAAKTKVQALQMSEFRADMLAEFLPLVPRLEVEVETYQKPKPTAVSLLDASIAWPQTAANPLLALLGHLLE